MDVDELDVDSLLDDLLKDDDGIYIIWIFINSSMILVVRSYSNLETYGIVKGKSTFSWMKDPYFKP